MRKLTRYVLIQMGLTRKTKREIYIASTSIVGFLLFWVLFGTHDEQEERSIYLIDSIVTYFYGDFHNHYYYVKYSVSILKSFVVFILADYALTITRSRRIVILMSFLTASMIMDLSSLLSTDIYYALKPFRYELSLDYVFTTISISFQSVYTYFEVACVLFCTTKLGWNYLNDKTSRSTTSDSWLFNPTLSECVEKEYIAQKKN